MVSRLLTRRVAVWIAVVGLCGTPAACAGDDDDGPAQRHPAAGPADEAVSELTAYQIGPDDLARTKPDTPERTLLSFWQAVQFGNADKAYGLLSEHMTESVSLRKFARDLPFVSPRFNSTPQIIQRDTSGDSADLAVNLLFYGKDAKVVAITPLTFPFVAEGGRWLLADLGYFAEKAAEGRAAEGG